MPLHSVHKFFRILELVVLISDVEFLILIERLEFFEVISICALRLQLYINTDGKCWKEYSTYKIKNPMQQIKQDKTQKNRRLIIGEMIVRWIT